MNTDKTLAEAVENAELAWAWYEAGDDKFGVADMYRYRDEAPTLGGVIAAYVEGARESARHESITATDAKGRNHD